MAPAALPGTPPLHRAQHRSRVAGAPTGWGRSLATAGPRSELIAATSGGRRNRRRRILFFGEAVCLAHVVRPLTLAQSLDPERYEVAFACGRSWIHLPLAAGIRSFAIPVQPAGIFLRNVARGAPGYGTRILERYLRADAAAIAGFAPDLVVHDFRLSVPLACRLARIPCLTLVNAHWSPRSAVPLPTPDVPVARLLGPRLTAACMASGYALGLRSCAWGLNRLRLRHGLPPVGDWRAAMCAGDRTAYVDIPALAPVDRLLPGHGYLGPLPWQPSVPLPPAARRDHRRAISITMGSSGDGAAVPAAVAAAKALGYRVLLATDQAQCWRDDPAVVAARLLPGLDAARISDAMICHGGSGTVYQALAAGIPVLGITTNPDQQLVMAGVERCGAGIAVSGREIDGQDLAGQLADLLAPGPRRQAATLAATIVRHDAVRTFGRLVARLLEVRGP